jgi:hypothetical protein
LEQTSLPWPATLPAGPWVPSNRPWHATPCPCPCYCWCRVLSQELDARCLRGPVKAISLLCARQSRVVRTFSCTFWGSFGSVVRDALAFVVLHVYIDDVCTRIAICVLYVLTSEIDSEIRKVCAKMSGLCNCNMMRIVYKVSGRLIVVT